MIKGIGTDIIELDRVEHLAGSEAFIKRILHDKEIKMLENMTSDKRRTEFIAGRFCVKEAYAKALGTGIGKLAFKDICCLNDKLGKPYIDGDDKAFVSIAHSNTMATATVVINQ